MSDLKLSPEPGDVFIGRPHDNKIRFRVLAADHEGVHAITIESDVTMLIPRDEWNRYVLEKTIVGVN